MFTDESPAKPADSSQKNQSTSGCLRLLGAVLRAALLAILHSGRVERTAHHVIAHAGKILYAAAADQHDRVLLQVVAFAADIANHLEAIGQAYFRHLAQSRVRLFRRGGVDARANASLLRAALERRHLALRHRSYTPLANQLIDRWHWSGPANSKITNQSGLSIVCFRPLFLRLGPTPQAGKLSPTGDRVRTPRTTRVSYLGLTGRIKAKRPSILRPYATYVNVHCNAKTRRTASGPPRALLPEWLGRVGADFRRRCLGRYAFHRDLRYARLLLLARVVIGQPRSCGDQTPDDDV